MSDRDIRKIMNSTAPSLNTDGSVSRSIPEGSTNFVLSNNRQLAMFKKHKGRLWKTYLSKDGNQYVDRTLTTNTLKYTNKFIDHRMFMHNFEYNWTSRVKIYVPWHGTGEQSDFLDERTAFLVPFTMVCHKLLFRPSAIDTADTHIVFTIEKVTDGSTSISTVATFDATTAWSGTAGTMITINESDWDNSPKVSLGEVVGIALYPDDDDIVSGARQFHITSVWRVEVVI
jgi:hypothetical protein